ncbi:hypothetical protein GPECTOR_12g438 [Gonium pectorale]|uniref:Uncharacterized protein n=1 Tax=Gonium pectorale TaxID=33097 RepID=A0A150GNW3_GONPE|nr:hypothetical protein GPECTOR_12g438 [Gonium pectorale]|eukprot:KXZ51475.1 hypothetical protein GPECTOR_12g438 [Gonium pectorale]
MLPSSSPSSITKSHLVLALSGLTSAYIAVARPTLSRANHGSASPPATLFEAGTSPALPASRLAIFRASLAIYIFAMGLTQLLRLGPYVFKFYTIWNWWLLGLYFALAAAASALCAKAERKVAAKAQSSVAPVHANGRAAAGGAAAPGSDPNADADAGSDAEVSGAVVLRAPSALSRACHALFLINSSTVIIVDAVCWGVLYPMLSRGPQTPEIERIIKRLLLTFTSYNQHGLNALFIWADLFLNRHRLAFHAVGPLGLWSLLFALWAHCWHAATGKWLYPFLDTSKPWAPAAYLGLYLVHWLAFGLVALLYRVKDAAYARAERQRAESERLRAGKGGKAE